MLRLVQHVQRARRVDVVARDGSASERGTDGIAASWNTTSTPAQARAAAAAIADVALDELDVVRDVGQVLALAGEEVVEDAHAVAARDQRARDRRPDEPGAAGDEVRAGHAGEPTRTAARAEQDSLEFSLVVSARPVDWKSTLNLPKTEFPMRADLARREPEWLARWAKERQYERILEARLRDEAPEYVLHDGPPYATGAIHYGTVLNKVLKDIVVRSQLLMGKRAVFRPGWDCHGLPIEQQVEKELGKDAKALDAGGVPRSAARSTR